MSQGTELYRWRVSRWEGVLCWRLCYSRDALLSSPLQEERSCLLLEPQNTLSVAGPRSQGRRSHAAVQQLAVCQLWAPPPPPLQSWLPYSTSLCCLVIIKMMIFFLFWNFSGDGIFLEVALTDMELKVTVTFWEKNYCLLHIFITLSKMTSSVILFSEVNIQRLWPEGFCILFTGPIKDICLSSFSFHLHLQ